MHVPPISPRALFVFGCGFLLLDQASKRIVQTRAANRCFDFGPFLRIRRVLHRDDSYLRKTSRTSLLLGWFVALICAALLLRSGGWFHSPAARLGLALAFAGAAGNLVDILRRRYVIDFIDLYFWPVFNLADVGIVAGLLMAAWPGA
jgi:signal peptidase II